MNRLSTSDLCDAHCDDCSGDFRVLRAPWQLFGSVTSFHGPVSTVQCHEDNALARAALEEPGLGRVLVIAGGGSTRRALLGGNLAALAVRNGWVGVVVDGAVRDRAEVDAEPLGVRALALCPMPPIKRGQGARDVPVQVCGVWVRPGEWLVADLDGVIVMPAMP